MAAMNPANIFLILTLLFLFSGCASSKKVNENLCPKIFIHTDEDIKLSETEERLICGDKEEEAYKLIPSYQASYMLTGFLQSKGYSMPRFEYLGDELHVYPGVQSRVEKIIVTSESPADTLNVDHQLLKRFHDEVITPKLLDEMEAQALTLLRNNSFPCAKVSSSVDVPKNEVTITLTDLKPFQFGVINKEKVEGLEESAFDRFYPFTAADNFSETKLTLAEKRFLRAGVVQGTYFQEKCDVKNQAFSLGQQYILGTSRTVRLGVGASTEVGPMFRAKWSNQRSGAMASLWEFNLQLSFKNQYLSFTSERYLWPKAPRRALLTTVEVERDDQATYEEITSKIKPHLQWTRDGSSRLWTWSTGPTLIAGSYRTNSEDANTRRINTGALEGMVQTKSHAYEVFDLHPEAGDFLQFNFDFRHPTFGFEDPLLKLNFSYLRLIELGDLGKGSAIGGIRMNSATTWVRDNVSLSDLPPSVKFYGGGSDDIRGFKLSTLPDNNGLGALTKLSLKFEFRKTYVFIPTIESFTFVDTAYFGARSWKVEDRLWYSPGTGLRWLSPIGLVQGYVARSLSSKTVKDDGNLFYLGLGGVF